MNMPVTDTIKLSESKGNFAIGLVCPYNSKAQVEGKDLFDLNLTYIIYGTDQNGIKNKDKQVLTSHSCNYEDFYNQFNDAIDFMSLDQFECLDKKDNPLQGLYTDEVFTYYEFSVLAKNDSVDLLRKIDEYLTEQDCKLELYYIDVTIDFDDYEKPIKPYINSVFIQLNPELFLKMNVYFKNQYFENDNFLLFVFDEGEKQTLHSFSRIEDYSLYKGLDRGTSNPSDKIRYANIYIRADTSKTVIKRKYQKVMEFYADSSSLLIALFELIYFIFSFINRFYADHSLSKKIFFFKEVESKHFNMNRNINQIKKLINLTKAYEEMQTIQYNNDNSIKDQSEKKIIEVKTGESNSLKEKINIYNQNTNKSLRNSMEYKIDEILRKNDIKKFGNKKVKKKINQKIHFYPKIYDLDENNKNIQTIQQSTNRNVIIKYKMQPMQSMQISINGSKRANLAKIEKVKFKYNVFEILLSYCGNFCKPEKLKVKNDLTEKAENVLNQRLDISLYIKNTILIDIMNQALINDKMKSMTKFISRPILSINKSEERDIDDFYKDYSANDFDKLYEEIKDVKQSKMTKAEKKIISLVNNGLNEMI